MVVICQYNGAERKVEEVEAVELKVEAEVEEEVVGEGEEVEVGQIMDREMKEAKRTKRAMTCLKFKSAARMTIKPRLATTIEKIAQRKKLVGAWLFEIRQQASILPKRGTNILIM